MSATDPVEYEGLPWRVICGPGRLSDLPAEVERLQAARVLLIDGLEDPERIKEIEALLGATRAETLSDVRPHVPLELAQAARKTAAELEIDCLLAVGGGSAIGLAKAVALETEIPIVAIPTTYAGSEMTPIYGITDKAHKQTGRDLRVLPRTVIYDPELTLSLPAFLTGPSGINAIAHCVEALWTPLSNPASDAIATDGIRLLAQGLRACIAKPKDIDARATAQRGAWLGGMSLATAGTALHHKACHVLGGTFDLPHAEVHAAVLPAVTEFFSDAAPEAVASVARGLGTDDAVAGLRALADDLGVSSSLGKLGLTEKDTEYAAELIAAEAPAFPRPATVEDVRGILKQAY